MSILKIIERIKEAYNLNNNTKLAYFLGIKPNTIASWKKKNSIDYELIINKCDKINFNWLFSGQGPMFIDEQSFYEPYISNAQVSDNKETFNSTAYPDLDEYDLLTLKIIKEEQISRDEWFFRS